MVQTLDKFRADHKGKCASCGNLKPLDAMIKETSRGYNCVDCVVQDEAQNLNYTQKNNDFSPITSEFKVINVTKFNKLIRWCLG